MKHAEIEWLSSLEPDLTSVFQGIEERALVNQDRVLSAYQDHRVSEHHLQGTFGYGHDDLGRDTLENIFAHIFGAEAALVRPHIASGTHAISSVLFGVLRPGDELLFITGHPYDTLEEVVGLRGTPGIGSLKDWGVTYREVDIRDFDSLDEIPWTDWLRDNTKMVMIQRSRGYSWRRSVALSDIQTLATQLKALRSDVVLFVDNCYGEFVETQEPGHVGADIMAGSLIKNPGGGLVTTGAYVCGRQDLIDKVACRVYAPGMGASGGATLNFNRMAYQGFFMAPHTVSQSLKGAVLAAYALSKKGLDVSPKFDEGRTDIIQALRFGERDKLVAFCQAIQKACPIDSYVTPIPDKVDGYGDEIIMAAGTFAEGSSIELSADGPLREPYVGYLQGGLSYPHCKLAVASIIADLFED